MSYAIMADPEQSFHFGSYNDPPQPLLLLPVVEIPVARCFMTVVKNPHKVSSPESPGLCCCKKGYGKQIRVRETGDGRQCPGVCLTGWGLPRVLMMGGL
jgi:hypothetical protein